MRVADQQAIAIDYPSLYENLMKPIPNGSERIKLPGRINVDSLRDFDLPFQVETIQSERVEAYRRKFLQSSALSGLVSSLSPPASLNYETIDSVVPIASGNEINSLTSISPDVHLSEVTILDSIVHRNDYSTLLYLNSQCGREAACISILELMQKRGLQLTQDDYCSMLNLYARTKNVAECISTFQKMAETHIPTSMSYSILIKCLVRSRRLSDAFKAYESAKSNGLITTSGVFTTLISGCSQIGDYDRAWRLFDYMRREVCSPDEIIYCQMIHVCAVSGNVEKALVLFREMMNVSVVVEENSLLASPHHSIGTTQLDSPLPPPSTTPHSLQPPVIQRRKLVPMMATFNALLNACSRNPNYYTDVFNILTQMQDMGFQPDERTYRYLLSACCTRGDVPRAKQLWKQMDSLIKSDSTHSIIQPLATKMLLCYSSGVDALFQMRSRCLKQRRLDAWNQSMASARTGSENVERIANGDDPVDVDEWITDDSDSSSLSPQALLSMNQSNSLRVEHEYLLDGCQTEADTMKKWACEAKVFFHHLQATSGPDACDGDSTAATLSIPMINSFLSVCSSFEMPSEAAEAFALVEQLQLVPSVKTFSHMIECLCKVPRSSKLADEFDIIGDGVVMVKRQQQSLPDGALDQQMALYRSNVQLALTIFKKYEDFRSENAFPAKWTDLDHSEKRQEWFRLGITQQDCRHEYYLFRHLIVALTRFFMLFASHQSGAIICKKRLNYLNS